ncbi:hypothetical protein Aab01nite_61340 [Paractinoplanes abujensis]|uniref:Nitroreductase n=1 Tax=Paractinoplanes abujensis TaxID=882441 RepID=A0A7W7CQN5_9ACTN|nr:hypothetical protein [Actinoplanes abujensis]MBB4692954.1 hypothetical protein [Actinoplanes abujensis]GID22544.1 hypothetical protein Aab01nite_61340 [Actinoplanes abujensis]
MSWVSVLREHEPLFRRAPSAHNTQPWTIDYRADEIVIGVDPARSLPDSDPTGRDLALGMGAFAETCLIVAADAGLCVDCDLSDPRLIRLVAAARRYDTRFHRADVDARRVARGPYAEGLLDLVILAALEPGIVHVRSRALAGELAAADRWMFGTPPVARELRHWLRLDPRDPRYHRDGLTDRALELSRPEARVLAGALRAYPLTRRLGLPALLAAGGRNLLRYDGSVLVLTGEDDDVREAGRRLLRTWLLLGRFGLAVHPLSQLLDCPATAGRLTARVGGRPLAVFRVGHPRHEPDRSARLPPTH